MPTRFWYSNMIDAIATSAITSTSEASASLGPENVQHHHKTKVWRTGTSTADESITFDLGSAQSPNSVTIFAHTLTASDSAIQLRGSTDNFAASDVLVGSLTYAATTIHLAFSPVSYRYWRVKFTKASAGVSRDIGRIFLGTFYEPTVQPDFDGFGVVRKDLSTNMRTAGGQEYSDQRQTFREFKLDYSGVPVAQVASMKTIWETVGTHTPFFVRVDTAGTNELIEMLYVKFKGDIAADVDGMDSDLTYKMRLELKEQL